MGPTPLSPCIMLPPLSLVEGDHPDCDYLSQQVELKALTSNPPYTVYKDKVHLRLHPAFFPKAVTPVSCEPGYLPSQNHMQIIGNKASIP